MLCRKVQVQESWLLSFWDPDHFLSSGSYPLCSFVCASAFCFHLCSFVCASAFCVHLCSFVCASALCVHLFAQVPFVFICVHLFAQVPFVFICLRNCLLFSFVFICLRKCLCQNSLKPRLQPNKMPSGKNEGRHRTKRHKSWEGNAHIRAHYHHAVVDCAVVAVSVGVQHKQLHARKIGLWAAGVKNF